MSTHLQDWVELLNAEQHVQVDKLREHARHGIASRVRGEVWLYLLDVLSEDKTAEISSLLSLNTSYQALPSSLPVGLTSLILKTALGHHTKRFRNQTYAGLITSITAESGITAAAATSTINNPGSGMGGMAMNMTSAHTHGGLGQGQGQGQARDRGPIRQNSGNIGPSSNSNLQRTSSPSLGYGNNPGIGAGMSDRMGGDHSSSFAQGYAHGHGSSAMGSSNISIPAPISLQPERTSLISQLQSGPSSDGSLSHDRDRDSDRDLNTIRSQLSRILPPPPSAPPSRHSFLSILEEVLGKFWNAENLAGRDDEYRRNRAGGLEGTEREWVYLCTPFLCCLSRPVGVFLGFQNLMHRLDTFPPVPSRLASFLTLFRIALPELHSYCEDEQVPYVQVGMSWMTTLLGKEMWLGDVLRLWDTYLAADDMFALHCYVCVAILATCKETLEELDGSEAKLMLLDLPPLDVDRLLQDAANLRVSFPLPRPVEDE
ncbi:hypothetical protein IAT40_006286 [Kwoniella sp. CBS 6097]